MSLRTVDALVADDEWSDLVQRRAMPAIDHDAMVAGRLRRTRHQLVAADVAFVVLVNPISLRYATGYRNYALFQSHIPTTYAFVPQDGPVVLHGAYGVSGLVDDVRPAHPLSFMDGGNQLSDGSDRLAAQIAAFLGEIGSANRRIAVEWVNPSITRALGRLDVEVVDGAPLVETARAVKSADEIEAMEWAIAVAQLGIAQVERAIRPGVSEVQLLGLLNYTNIANDGDWHDGRMVASGPRTNPWLQEASARRIEGGDLVAFDTDMIGPFGYCADISRTMYCGPGAPTRRQRELYRLAAAEIDHNIALVRPGITLREFQHAAYVPDEEFHENAYTCIVHGVGMCDEYPRINPSFRGPNPYDATIEEGMVLCIESYHGAAGESDGVKLEQQVLVTAEGCRTLSTYPLDEQLLS